MSQPPSNCPICGRMLATHIAELGAGTLRYVCDVCGTFRLPEQIHSFQLGVLFPKHKAHLLSAYLRANPALRDVSVGLWDGAMRGDIPERAITEKIDSAFDVFCERSSTFGQAIRIDVDHDYPLAWCRDQIELGNILKSLVQDRAWLETPDNLSYRVTAKGWEQRGNKSQGQVGFVAMSFNPNNAELMPLFETIAAAIRAAGYEPKRIDKDPHNGGIMDRIIATIRQSRFIVADLTENKAGVYHEAGFAMGRGIPVFYTSKEDQLGNGAKNPVHFDVAHINITPWLPNKLADFQEALQNKIEANIGKGPIQHQEGPKQVA